MNDPETADSEARSVTMLIREIMTGHVEFVTPHETLRRAAVKMRDSGVGTLPVCENQGIVGMLTDRDITIRGVAEGRDPETTEVRDVMSGELICCYDDQNVDVAAHLMQSQHIRRVLVLNRDRRLVGIVSLADLALGAHNAERAGEILHEVCGAASQV
jgi:CBS domain-containing protein